MKFALILGALAGFAIGVLSGLAAKSSWQTCVVNGSAGALGLALLLRWWRKVWMRSLAESLEQQYQEAQQALRKDAQPTVSGKL
jgi:hypothetical protein